jgi:protein phosphatase
MWRKADSRRFVPRDIGRSFRAAAGEPEAQHARRQPDRDIRLDRHGQSRIGDTRRVNQDQFFSLALKAEGPGLNCFLGVADGIGGAPRGGDASALVVQTLKRFLKEEEDRLVQPDRNDGAVLETLARGLRRCHGVLQDIVNGRPEFSGMGTTLTAGLLLWPKLYLVHLGDARAYLLRDGELGRLTHDHTYAQALLEAGVLNERTVKTSAMRNVLSNFLSGDLPEKDPDVHPDTRILELRTGDTLLFCTDGLTHVVADDELARILASGGSARELAGTLMGRSRDLQARDDATVLVARFEELLPGDAGRRHAEADP